MKLPCQAEVGKLDSPVAGKQDVRRFDVPVDHAQAMHRSQAFDNSPRHSDGLGRLEPLPRL